MSTDLSGPTLPVTAHGKFLSRAGSKFFLKAMRLEEPSKAPDFNAKVELRARLEELKTGHTTTLLVKAGGADATLDLAAASGLHTLLEIACDADRLLDRAGLRSLRTEIAETARHFGNRAGLIGFLLSPTISADWLRMAGLDRVRNAIAKLVRHLKRHSNG
ncbi:MAG TPA: hypothetical protein VFE56_10800, partial [Candidatus Binataceae bacterium]|nr:hypothetical protein [Candidatus Binataceae bacterium]